VLRPNFSSTGESFRFDSYLHARQNASLNIPSHSPHVTYSFLINEGLQTKSLLCSLLPTSSHLHHNNDLRTESRIASGLPA
jgi:hypothetical protein